MASLTTEALEAYLSQQEWQIAAIDDAVEIADNGDFVSHDAVSAWLSSWGTQSETSAPKPRKAAQ